jgi:hypothetical protein
VKTNRTMKWTIILAVTVLMLLTASTAAQSGDVAAPNASYTLFWWTVDGGGDTSVTVGKYTLSGTAGQPDAGELSQGSYTLGGGFWGGGVLVEGRDRYIYLPLVLRSLP